MNTGLEIRKTMLSSYQLAYRGDRGEFAPSAISAWWYSSGRVSGCQGCFWHSLGSVAVVPAQDARIWI